MALGGRSYFENVLWFVVFLAAYYIAYRYGIAFSQFCASPFWFPNAVLLCALLKCRPGFWWIFVLATIPVRLLSTHSQGIPAWFLLSAFMIDAAEVLLGAVIAHRYVRNPTRPESIRDFTFFSIFIILALPALAAIGGGAICNGLGYDFRLAWSEWFLGNALAQLVATPFILYWVFNPPGQWRNITSVRFLEVSALIGGLVTTGYLAFNTGASSIYFADVRFYAPVPLLFWAALRFGMRGAAGAIAAISFFAVDSAASGRGPFVGHSPSDTAVLLQNFLLLRSVPLYFIAALVEKMRIAEQSLRESEARFRHMAHNAPVLIWMSGPDKLSDFFNQVWLDFTGRSLQQELGFGWAEAVHERDLKYCVDVYQNAFDARKDFEMEYRLLRYDGEYRWILDKGVPRYAQNGDFAGYIGSAIDITDLKRAEEVNRALAHAQRLAVMGELTAAIAHEVRQPLSAISLNAQTVEKLVASENPSRAAMREIVADIRADIVKADAAISRIRAFLLKQDKQLQPLDANVVVTDVLWLVSADALRRGIGIRTDLEPDLPPVLGDRTQLQQVLLNLIVNGMEAMDGLSGAEPHIAVRSRRSGDGNVEISVTDHGCGITVDRFPFLFETFFTTKAEGMGLGLSIARSIVAAHKGDIWAENGAGGGTTIHFSLPATT